MKNSFKTLFIREIQGAILAFVLSMLVTLLIVYVSGVIPIFSKELFPSVLVMIGVSLVFLFALLDRIGQRTINVIKKKF